MERLRGTPKYQLTIDCYQIPLFQVHRIHGFDKFEPYQFGKIKRLDEIDNFYDHSESYLYMSDLDILESLRHLPEDIHFIINPTKEMIDLVDLLKV
jgi:hypothetical protein